jgi:hypothetical protein
LLKLRESGRSAAETWLAHGMDEPYLQRGVLSDEYSEIVLPSAL